MNLKSGILKRAVVACFAAVILLGQVCFAKYSGGAGTAEDPYRIANAANLLALAADTNDYYSRCFVLTADIDLGSYDFTTAVIASDTNSTGLFPAVSFAGEFNGNGHKISNLTIKGEGAASRYLGLFGSASGSNIRNLRLENVSIDGGVDSNRIGGLVGSDRLSTISNCSSTGTITGGWAIGGLVGESSNSVISNCSFIGSISGTNALGGLVGYCGLCVDAYVCAECPYGKIENCCSSGVVTGGDDSSAVGGLIGFLWQVSTPLGSDVNRCYSAAVVTVGNNSSDIGGLVGRNWTNSIYNSFFLQGSWPDNNCGQPLTNEQMKQQASFVGWDFNNIWRISQGVDYPKLARQLILQVDKCTVTAGSKVNSDKISFSGTMNAIADDFNDANVIVTIDSNDIVSPCVKTFPIVGNFKKGKFKCSASNASFALDTKTSKFSFTAKNVSLKGLSCPLTVQIKIGDSIGTAEVSEDVVNGTKPIPINLLMGIKNVLRVEKPYDKFQVKHNTKKPSADQLSVKGGFAVADTGVNMADANFVVEFAGHTFTIPADSFKPGKGKFTCSNVDTSNGIASATFDFNKCVFTLTIKNADITSSGDVHFDVTFSGFSEGAEVSLP
jgi:hypothetical protein